MDKKSHEKKRPLHITQAFGIKASEEDLDFFDANLYYDSLLFLDPFLLKSSPQGRERALYNRFTDYFKRAHTKSIEAKKDFRSSQELLRFLKFPEPREIYLGYTELSNEGRGQGEKFALALHSFFLSETAKRILSKEYFEEEINPAFFVLFADKFAEDGISDLTANLIMDYLIQYTQEQCRLWGVETKTLKVNQTFDYEESYDWTYGIYARLPENPLRTGEAIVFVPKRLLRASELTKADIKSKIKGILKENPILKEKFAGILQKPISEISDEEIRNILLGDDVALKTFVDFLKREKKTSYDFGADPLQFLAYKKFMDFFAKKKTPEETISCEELLKHAQRLVQLFKEQYERADSWKNAWTMDRNGNPKPIKEVAWGRDFRGAGFAYFDRDETVTFLPEVSLGRGTLDFSIIFKDCKIALELKLLKNQSLTGDDKLPAFLHGIRVQLPEYATNLRATHAFYITGQHFRDYTRKKANHDSRANKIRGERANSERKIRRRLPDFKKLFYVNIDLTPKRSFSKL